MNRRGFLILSYVTLASFASTIITPALPHIAQTLEINKIKLDWLMTIFLLGFAIGQLVYGPLANKTSRIWSLRIGILIYLFGIALAIPAFLMKSYIWLMIARFLAAFGGASGLVCAFILLVETFDENQIKVLIPYIGLFFSVSIVLSIFIGGFLAQYVGFIYCFVFNFVYATVLLFLTRNIKETLHSSDHEMHPQIGRVKKPCPDIQRVISFSIGASLVATFSYAYSNAIPIFAQTKLNLSEFTYGVWNLLNLVGMLLCALFAGKICIRIGTAKTGKWSFLGFFLGIVLLFLYSYTSFQSRLGLFCITSYLYLMAGTTSSCSAFFAMQAYKDKAIASSILNFVTLFLGGVSLFLMSYLPFQGLIAFGVTLVIFYLLALLFFMFSKKIETKV